MRDRKNNKETETEVVLVNFNTKLFFGLSRFFLVYIWSENSYSKCYKTYSSWRAGIADGQMENPAFYTNGFRTYTSTL